MNKRLYSRIIPFGTDSFIVHRKRLWGIVDSRGKVLLPIVYNRVHWFEGGYAGIQDNNKWGLVDANGHIKIGPQYDSLLYYSFHKACKVESGDDIFVVDVNNNTIMRVAGGKVRYEGNKLIVFDDHKCQLYNNDGSPFSQKHDAIHAAYGSKFFQAYDYAENNRGHKILIKPNGEEVQMPSFEQIGVFYEQIAPFKNDGKYGIVDENGKILVPNKYAFICLGDGVIAVKVGGDDSFLSQYEGTWQFWNYQFEKISPYDYERKSQMKYDGKTIWFGKRGGSWYQITPQGESLFAENDEMFNTKKEYITRKKRIDANIGELDILEDPDYKGEGRKLYVCACDGRIIRHFYYTPYIPMPLFDVDAQWTVGDSFVNKYGQDMPNPHSFKMPKQEKHRFIFKYPNPLSEFKEDELMSVLISLLKEVGIDKEYCAYLCVICDTFQKKAVLADWLMRKLKRNKNVKFEREYLLNMTTAFEKWLKKHK